MAWIETYRGGVFDYKECDPSDVSIEDIAHALSMICRYTGHTKEFYSVAEHSVWASMMAPDGFKLEALLHDAHEAYVGDVAAPLKSHLDRYNQVESHVESVVRASFGLPPHMSRQVKEVDMRMLVTEKDQAMRSEIDWGFSDIEPYNVRLWFLPPKDAEHAFLSRFRLLIASSPATVAAACSPPRSRTER